MSKLKKLFLAVAGLVVVSGSTAFALNASDFYLEAATYSFQKCQTTTSTDRLANTVCFLLYEQANNQIRWALQKNTNTDQANNNADQQTAIDSLQSGAISKTNVYRRDSSPATVTSTTPATAEAFCDDTDDIALSGGFTSSPDKKMHVTASTAGDESTGISSWVVTGFGEAPNGFEFLAYVNCYKVN